MHLWSPNRLIWKALKPCKRCEKKNNRTAWGGNGGHGLEPGVVSRRPVYDLAFTYSTQSSFTWLGFGKFLFPPSHLIAFIAVLPSAVSKVSTS